MGAEILDGDICTKVLLFSEFMAACHRQRVEVPQNFCRMRPNEVPALPRSRSQASPGWRKVPCVTSMRVVRLHLIEGIFQFIFEPVDMIKLDGPGACTRAHQIPRMNHACADKSLVSSLEDVARVAAVGRR